MLGLNWKSKPPDLGNPSELTEIESDIRIVMKSTRNLSKGPYPKEKEKIKTEFLKSLKS